MQNCENGNLQECGNWIGVTLLPKTNKVFSKIIINRTQPWVDSSLWKKQAGFRIGLGIVDQIFILKNILGWAIEWNATLYKNRRGRETYIFQNKCPVMIHKILWATAVSNKAILEMAGQKRPDRGWGDEDDSVSTMFWERTRIKTVSSDRTRRKIEKMPHLEANGGDRAECS